MGNESAGNPAARAIVPPHDPGDSDISGARLTAPRQEGAPASASHPVEGNWAQLATAPTLFLRPTQESSTDDAASTSRMATPQPMALEEQPWFRTGTTTPPPSMRPSGESIVPAPARKPPNPRVLKVVYGVFAACIFIVAVAAIKLVHKRLTAPAARDDATAVALAKSEAGKAPSALPESTSPQEGSRPSPETTAAASPTPAPAQVESSPKAAPARPAPSPVHATTKTTTRHAPTPKKTTRSH